MNRVDVLSAFAAQRVIPVLRSSTLADALATARVLASEGLAAVELTTSVPDVLTGVRTLRREGLVVGLGTVRDAATVRAAAQAGAAFVVSYFHPEEFMPAARESGVLGIPGAFTPHELQAATSAGATLAKLFPAWQSSPRLIQDLAPLVPGLRLLPTGGLDASAVGAWLDAGAVAVGVGSDLGTVASHGTDGVRERVRTLLAVLPPTPAQGVSAQAMAAQAPSLPRQRGGRSG